MVETITWVRNPQLAPPGYRDSTVFVSAVTSICEQSRLDDEIRDLLMYLLLRRQPFSDVLVPLEHASSDTDIPVKIDLLRSASQDCWKRQLNLERSKPYSTLQLIMEIGSTHSASWPHGSEVALLALALWLFDQSCTTEDISTIRACLNLYTNHTIYKAGTLEGEFINDTLRYTHWLMNEIVRICELNYTYDERLNELAYIGIFASMIRACRMTTDDHPIHRLLGNEVAKLKTRLHEQEKVKCSQYLTLTRKLRNDSMVHQQ